MPCDTPPPPPAMEKNYDSDEEIDIVEEVDESNYEIIDLDELEDDEGEDVDVDPPQDDSIRTFKGHSEAIFTCNFDNTGKYIATGSQDDTALIFNTADGTICHKVNVHKDSVIAATFSPDSKYMASADMAGIVQVLDIEDGSVVWSFETYEFAWADWFHGSNVLLAGSNDGSCWRFSIPDGDSHVYENPGFKVSRGAISFNDEKLCVGYKDGSLKFWDLNTNSQCGSFTGSAAFKDEITDITFSPDNSLLLASSIDGSLKLIKMSNLKVIWDLVVCDRHNEVHGEEMDDNSVETVAFCNNPSNFAAGTNCGTLCVFDIPSKTRRFVVNINNTVILKLICDEKDPVLYAALTDNGIHAYDVRTGKLLKQWDGHSSSVYDIALSRDRSFLITSSEDCTCKLFERGALPGLS